MSEFIALFTANEQSESGQKEKFFSPIKKSKIKTFQDSAVKITVQKGNKCKEIAFQRDVLVMLVAHSNMENAGIFLQQSLSTYEKFSYYSYQQ